MPVLLEQVDKGEVMVNNQLINDGFAKSPSAALRSSLVIEAYL
jgi:hypothetical protein